MALTDQSGEAPYSFFMGICMSVVCQYSIFIVLLLEFKQVPLYFINVLIVRYEWPMASYRQQNVCHLSILVAYCAPTHSLPNSVDTQCNELVNY